MSFWNPDENGQVKRNSRAGNAKPGLSRFTECVLHQGRMEQFFLDAIRASAPPTDEGGDDGGAAGESKAGGSRVRVERMVLPTSLSIDDSLLDGDAHPVTVTLRHLTEAEATPAQRLSNLSDGLFRSNLAEDDVDDLLRKSARREDAAEEVVKAKYVVGCDGAHSWTRKALGKEFEMVGETTDFIW